MEQEITLSLIMKSHGKSAAQIDYVFPAGETKQILLIRITAILSAISHEITQTEYKIKKTNY